MEVEQRPTRGRAEDPVGPTAVETEVVEAPLEVGDIVTAQHRRVEHQQSITEDPARFDQRQPGGFVTGPTAVETTLVLERGNCGLGDDTKQPRLSAIRLKAGGTESALEISDRIERVRNWIDRNANVQLALDALFIGSSEGVWKRMENR